MASTHGVKAHVAVKLAQPLLPSWAVEAGHSCFLRRCSGVRTAPSTSAKRPEVVAQTQRKVSTVLRALTATLPPTINYN